jgi:hypothetical protein
MSNKKTDEVFAESVTLQERQDVRRYIECGGPIKTRTVPYRALYRLRVDLKSGCVRYEFLASFNARLIATEGSADNPIAVVAGRGASGSSFMCRCPLEWLTSGKPHHARKFYGALLASRGFIGSFIFPGKLAATIRAILALSEEREPMPADWGELEGLDAGERDDFWNQ